MITNTRELPWFLKDVKIVDSTGKEYTDLEFLKVPQYIAQVFYEGCYVNTKTVPVTDYRAKVWNYGWFDVELINVSHATVIDTVCTSEFKILAHRIPKKCIKPGTYTLDTDNPDNPDALVYVRLAGFQYHDNDS